MNSIQQAAIRKKSFELNFNGGTIWCEHLDGMDAYEDEVIAKFKEDKMEFSRPSVSSLMIIDLDKTDITEQIVRMITDTILETNKLFRKIAFVGVEKHWHKQLSGVIQTGIAVRFIGDYEKAKEWVISE
ncbi:MAG: hypothetical protein K6C13_15130 [Oscillospiraceae bacterium]|nr:hypothetical protein [Oscillospiraceae bacterium]